MFVFAPEVERLHLTHLPLQRLLLSLLQGGRLFVMFLPEVFGQAWDWGPGLGDLRSQLRPIGPVWPCRAQATHQHDHVCQPYMCWTLATMAPQLAEALVLSEGVSEYFSSLVQQSPPDGQSAVTYGNSSFHPSTTCIG